jgi:predicted RNase H-like HicB family nuclease
MDYQYPVEVEKDEDGFFILTVFDLKGCFADGKDQSEALENAQDAASEWLAQAVSNDRAIPAPSAADGRPVVSPDPALAAKVTLYSEMRAREMNKLSFSALLEMDYESVCRVLDPGKKSTLPTLQRCLEKVGVQMVVSFSPIGHHAAAE